MSHNVRVRFAPSPTGYLHVGSLRTALYNYLFAKKQGGDYILRVEDTDQKRYVEGAIESLVRSLDNMHVGANEGVILEGGAVVERGEYGPYQQSKRLPLYQEQADILLASGKAYRCFCTPERLTALREAQVREKQAPRYDKHCLALSEEEISSLIASGATSVVRLNIDPRRGEIRFHDLIRGTVKFLAKDLDDQILIKTDGFPTGVFAIAVDDNLMHITHVVKGEEWLSTTPKQVLIYEAFGWTLPEFAHLPLILNPDRSKLSKRQGDVAVEDYLQKGYLKEAIVNFVALLGWNPGKGSTQEIFSLDELVQVFDIAQIHKGGAVFDIKKLDWMNSEYIKRLSIDALYTRVVAFGLFEDEFFKVLPAEKKSESFLKKVLVVEHDRLVRLSDIGVHNPFFFADELSYEASLLRWKDNDVVVTKNALMQAEDLLKKLPEEDFSTLKTLEEKFLQAAGDYAQSLGGNEAGRGRGDFLWPLRVALTGADRSPSPAQVAWVLGKEESLARVHTALQKFA